LSQRAHSDDSSGYLHPDNAGLQDQSELGDSDAEDVVLKESGHHSVSPIISDQLLSSTKDEISDGSKDEFEDEPSTSSNQLAYHKCLQFGRPKRIRKSKKFLTYDKRGVPSYVSAQATPPNKRLHDFVSGVCVHVVVVQMYSN